MEAFTHHEKSLSAGVNLWANGSYTGKSFADGVAEILGEKIEIAKRNELHTFKVCHNDGSLSALLAGLKNAGDFGKTVSVSSMPVCN